MAIEKSDLLTLAKEREGKWLKKDKETKQSKFTKKFQDITTSKIGGTYCIPPSIKARLLTTLRTDIKGQGYKYRHSKDDNSKTKHLQSIVKRLATYNRIMNNARTCSTKGKSIEKEMDIIGYNEDNILEIVDRMKEDDDKGKKPKGPKSLNTWIREEHYHLWKKMWSIAYDGEKEGVEQDDLVSICGNSFADEIGSGSNAAQNALDKMAFFGTKFDWLDYYVHGEKDVINDNGTFEPMSKKDVPGCAMKFKGVEWIENKKEEKEEIPVVKSKIDFIPKPKVTVV